MARIIVQDADQDILDIICIALELEGFSIFTVLGFDTDFIALIERYKPHAVMLDFGLAEQECIKICKAIKISFPELPVIVLSCHAQIGDIYQNLGFDDYIAKPFDLKDLFQTLRKHIPESSLLFIP